MVPIHGPPPHQPETERAHPLRERPPLRTETTQDRDTTSASEKVRPRPPAMTALRYGPVVAKPQATAAFLSASIHPTSDP